MASAVAARVLVLGAALLVVFPTVVGAQAELQMWLNPELGKQIPRADYRFTNYPDRKVDNQETHLGLSEHRVSLFVPLFQDTANEWGLSARTRFEDIDTRARFPEVGGRFPSELWDVGGTLSFRHKFDSGWIGGLALTAGSASDEPFHSIDEVYYRGVAMLRVPQGERNAWLFSVIYATDERFLSWLGAIPIPGIAYQWVPSDRFQLIIGIPFSSVQYRPLEKLTLEAQYFPVRRVRARATYEVFRPLRVFAGFDWDSEHYARTGRGDKDDRLFYYEKSVRGGIRFDLRHFGVELTGGRAFDRFYFEGETYSNRDDNRIDIHDGWFGAAQLSVRF